MRKAYTVKKLNGKYSVNLDGKCMTELINGNWFYYDDLTKEEAEQKVNEVNNFKFIGE